MAYTPVHAEWEDSPSTATPVMAADLEHIEAGIVAAALTADGAVQGDGVVEVVAITQAAYDLLPTPRDSAILYVITD